MNLQKLNVAFILLISPGIALCSSPWKVSVGVGADYGLTPGVQASYLKGANRFHIGTSVFGLSLGYEYAVMPSHTLGIGILGNILVNPTEGVSVSYHYYPNGVSNTGFRYGLNVGYLNEGITSFSEDGRGRTFIYPSIGYQY